MNNISDQTEAPADTKPERARDIDQDAETEYPPLKVVVCAMLAVFLSFFLVALDRTILGTAIPAISAEFHSFGDISWYEAGFLLPLCMLQLTFGRVYRFYSTKKVLIALVTIFQIGSIICAAAPNSNALIVGRVVTGIGGAGIGAGCFFFITLLVPLESRPIWSGSLGAAFGVSSILGPILGGYLTSVTWRWCFWINLPFGVISIVILMLLAPKTPPVVQPAQTWKGRVTELDPLGFVFIAPATACLLFALQWGGTLYPWNSGRIIALLVLFAVLSIVFIVTQIWRGDEATIPPRIFLRRTMFAGSIASMGIGSLLVIFSFYLPIWFQAIQGKDTQQSGLSLLPQLLSTVVFVVSSGFITSAIGYYNPLLIAGSAAAIVGASLISTWPVDAIPGQWIGYQIITGAGLGFALQQPQVAVQIVMSKEDNSIGLSIVSFFSLFGGSIFVAVAQSLLQNRLATGLQASFPDLNAATIVTQGAATIRQLVPPEKLPLALEIYNDSLRAIWYLAAALGALTLISAFVMEWKSVKKGAVAATKLDVEGESKG